MALHIRSVGRLLSSSRVWRTAASIRFGHGDPAQHLSLQEFDQKYIQLFSSPKSDGWDVRKAMTDIHGMDLIPEPEVVIAGLKACRRLNDLALAIRFLEAVKHKCGNRVDVVWPYILQEIRPTLDELGVPTPEEIGYDKPELALKSVYSEDYFK